MWLEIITCDFHVVNFYPFFEVPFLIFVLFMSVIQGPLKFYVGFGESAFLSLWCLRMSHFCPPHPADKCLEILYFLCPCNRIIDLVSVYLQFLGCADICIILVTGFGSCGEV